MATARIERFPLAAPECRIAIAGFGTVGHAVARLLYSRRDDFPLRLTHIFNRNVGRKKAGWIGRDVVWTEDLQPMLDSGVDVIVELMGGLEPAHQLVRAALQSGKSVVTANKQLIARFGTELLQLANDNGQYLSFGAAVAGGVPVLSALQDGLGGDHLIQLRGILNGTCNYILTRIEQGGISFSEALSEAQQAGFAEADPTDDIDGHDAAAKLAILARVGLKIGVTPDQVLCGSIRNLAAIDFEYARELGCTIRQVSTARLHGGRVYLAVEPSLVPLTSPFASVVGSQNLVVSTGEFGGETTFGGHGAGGNPTAVAVVSDLLQTARNCGCRGRTVNHADIDGCEITRDFEAPQYLRFVVRDQPGIIAQIAGVLAQHHINLDAILQRPGYDKCALPFVITLEACKPASLEAALHEIANLDFLAEAPLRMPIMN
jgi:homoserine dehydrogenase